MSSTQQQSSQKPIYRIYQWGMHLTQDDTPVTQRKTAGSGAAAASSHSGSGTKQVDATPREIFRSSEKIKMIRAGSQYNVVLFENGTVRAWGRGSRGRLGTLPAEQDQSLPTEIKGLQNIVHIATDEWFSLFVDGQGKLWRSGKFGKTTHVTPQQEPFFGETVKASKCAAGNQLIAVLSIDGEIYAYGSTEFGKIGVPPKKAAFVERPQRITCPSGSKFIDVSIRADSLLAVSEDGLVWGMGNNVSKQLGLPDAFECSSQLRQVSVPSAACQVITSTGKQNQHSCIVASDGTMYSCGSNYKFMTGLPIEGTNQNNTHNVEKVAPPAAVPIFQQNNIKIAKASCAGLHTLAIDAEGALYLWGCGSDGRLGFPEFKERNARYLYHEPQPRKLTSLVGRVIDADSYKYHTVAVTVEEKR